jgi:hypothetical protein
MLTRKQKNTKIAENPEQEARKMNLLLDLLKVGGITALAIGVLYLLYKQLMAMKIFPVLNKQQSFRLLVTLIVLVFLVVLLSFASTGAIDLNEIMGGDNNSISNTINSGDSSNSTIVTGSPSN